MLVLKKKNKTVATYVIGDKFKFKMKGEDYYTEQMIVGFAQDKIRFHYFDIKLDEIEQVHKRKNRFLVDASSKIMTAGVLFLLADQFNQTIINDQKIDAGKNTAIISGSIFATGLVMNLLGRSKVDLNKPRYRLEIVGY